MTQFRIGESVRSCFAILCFSLWLVDLDDLRRCASVSETVTKQYTYMTGSSPCKICPNEQCETIGNYSPSGKVILTCYAKTIPPQCLDYCLKPDPTSLDMYQSRQQVEWYKTINNCYVKAVAVQAGRKEYLI